jgi:predicted site-specific integrase-resolvase
MHQHTQATKLFDNLVDLDGIIAVLEASLGKRYHHSTVRRWIKEGMPVVRLRTGKLFFRPDDVATWLQRTS